jgi:hypothetical protein
MRLKTTNCSKVILCCMALHNFLINSGHGYFDAPSEYVENTDDDYVLEEDEME